MIAPRDYRELIELLGDPAPFIRPDGTVREAWEEILAPVTLPSPLPLSWRSTDPTTGAPLPPRTVHMVRAHVLVARLLETVLESLYDAGHWGEVREFGGIYCWRSQRGGSKLSVHCWGAAIDLNPSTNQLGTVGNMAPEVIAAFESAGWFWGGRWRRPDPMHFQFCAGSY